MKKYILGFITVLLLSGCSLLGEVNNSLDYVNEATDHINRLSQFAEDAPQMVRDAATDPAVKEDLTNQLKTLKEEINAFNEIEAPTIAKDIHKKLVEKNEAVLTEVNKALEDGQLAVEKLQNSPIFKTIQETKNLLNQLENLGL